MKTKITKTKKERKKFFEKFSKSNLIKKYGVIPLTESIIYLENKKTKKLIEDIILNRKKNSIDKVHKHKSMHNTEG